MAFYIFKRIFHFFDRFEQWEKLFYYVDTYVFHNPIGALLIILMFLAFAIAFLAPGFSNGSESVRWRFRLLSFVLYSVGLFLLYIVIKNTTGSGFKEFSLSQYITEDNLGYHEETVLITVTHLLLFMPFGYWLTRLLKRHWIINIIVVLVVSFGIETLQLILKKGYFAKQDIVAYMVGSLVGAIVARITMAVGVITQKREKKDKITT